MRRYRSTANVGLDGIAFREALFRGQAPDGGLYFPESLPQLVLEKLRDSGFAGRARGVMHAWLDEDVDAGSITAICGDAFDFPVPVTRLDERTFLLELFHGPTAAFKDFGARFMARAMALLRPRGRRLTVLVATSGDTGSAVAHAFAGIEDTTVVLLFPSGMVSPLQEAQLTAVPDNVSSLRVSGTFDDCQAMVKAAFRNERLVAQLGLTSANSINIGRLLPQSTYYVHASLELVDLGARQEGNAPLVVVPSGNLGNLTAGLYAKKCGAPIGRFLAAANRNDAFPRFLESGLLEAQPTRQTPSNAMDVGNPSNAVRITALYENQVDAIRQDLSACSISDEETLATIRNVHELTGRFVCPHTAVGLAALAQVRGLAPTGAKPSLHHDGSVAIVLATAHPGKFAEVVREATGQEVELPAVLEEALRNSRPPLDIAPHPEALYKYLQGLA